MVDMASISLAIATAKNMTQLLQALSKSNKQIEVNDAIIELQNTVLALQSHLLSAQQEQSELIKIKEQIEKDLMNHKNRDIEKDKYELVKYPTGTLLYKIKSPQNSTKEELRFCPKCFDDGNISMLQPLGDEAFSCNKCKNTFTIKDIEPNSASWGFD